MPPLQWMQPAMHSGTFTIKVRKCVEMTLCAVHFWWFFNFCTFTWNHTIFKQHNMHFYLVLSSDLYFKIYDTPRKKLEKSASNLEVCAIVCLREKFKTFFQTQILIFGWKTIFIILLFFVIYINPCSYSRPKGKSRLFS